MSDNDNDSGNDSGNGSTDNGNGDDRERISGIPVSNKKVADLVDMGTDDTSELGSASGMWFHRETGGVLVEQAIIDTDIVGDGVDICDLDDEMEGVTKSSIIVFPEMMDAMRELGSLAVMYSELASGVKEEIEMSDESSLSGDGDGDGDGSDSDDGFTIDFE